MTTDRTEEGVRVRVKRTGESGTVLYGPHKRHDRTWPGFSLAGAGWTVPVRFDRDGWRGVGLYSPSELEPGPPRRVVNPSRRVRHKETGREGEVLTEAWVDGVRWPGLGPSGHWRVPVQVAGDAVAWDVRTIEPVPSPAWVPGEPPYGPRVMVRSGGWPASRLGRVMYRWAGAREESRIWPNFADGRWLVPVRMEATGGTLLVLATDLEPFAEPERGPVGRALFDQAETEATILDEADKLANDIQAKNLRVLAGAAADALELFASRLRDIELGGDGA